MAKAGRTKPRGKRPTIGLLTYGTRDTIASDMWAGVSDVAEQRGVNALCFPYPWWLTTGRTADVVTNIVFDLAGTENVDGLVIWGGAVVGPEEPLTFYQRYLPLPLVSVALPVEGIPSLLVDNYGAMRQVILHLVEVHGYRRIAFVCGPVGNIEAEERHRAYVDVLNEQRIGLLPSLVIEPSIVSYDEEGGAEAVHLLLDERGMQPGADFEAVVASNDRVALGALGALQGRGIRVPEAVAVAGFDDVEEAGATTPPLTTVWYSCYELGKRAAEMLLDQMAGQKVGAEEVLSLKLMVRQSCGCLDPSVVQAAVDVLPAEGADKPSTTQVPLYTAFAGRRTQALSDIVQAVGGNHEGTVPERAERLLNSFIAEMEEYYAGLGNTTTAGPSGRFIRTLGSVLREVMVAGSDSSAISGRRVAVWQDAVSMLRRHTLPHLDQGMVIYATNLWEQARVMIGETAQRAEAQQALRAARHAELLREIGEALATTPDVADLAEVLVRELPRLGIPSAYLSLYEDPTEPTAWSRLILGYDAANSPDSKRVAVEGEQRFPSRQLVPEGVRPEDRRYSYVVEPLYYLEQQLGLALLEVGPREGEVYEALRGEISSALQGTLLTEQAARRALQLQTAAEVSRAATSVLDLSALLQQVVELVQQRFDLYYVGLFLIEGADSPSGPSAWAVLRAASGEAGRQMLEQGHQLEIGGASMIGQCITDHQPRVALDVGEEAVRFDNPLLSETHSEMALPLVTREGAIGALSVQSRERRAFDEAEVAVFETLAGQLANAIANARAYDQVAHAYDEIQRLNERLKDENLRMAAELEVTRRLQQMLLPAEEELRQIEGLDIAGYMEPAAEVGGDYYDVLQHDGSVKIGIGDVTGHGLESGVVMLMLQTAVRTLLTEGEEDPVRFLEVLNQLLRDNIERMQVSKSMTLSLLDYETGRTAAPSRVQLSGQHEYVIVVRAGGKVELLDTLDLGFPLGIEKGITQWVDKLNITLTPGDGIVLYSDGITEAENDAGDFYGLERLCEVVQANWVGTAKAVKEAVITDVKDFIGEHKVYDDITLLIVKQK